MPLNSEQVNQIANDILSGREPKIKGKEVDEFRKELEEDIRQAKASGAIVEIPMEWEV